MTQAIKKVFAVNLSMNEVNSCSNSQDALKTFSVSLARQQLHLVILLQGKIWPGFQPLFENTLSKSMKTTHSQILDRLRRRKHTSLVHGQVEKALLDGPGSQANIGSIRHLSRPNLKAYFSNCRSCRHVDGWLAKTLAVAKLQNSWVSECISELVYLFKQNG